jgi:hypothetical protein
MKRLLFVLAAFVLFASTASADITVTATMSVKAAQMSTEGTIINFVKGTKFRVDTKIMSQEASLLSDSATGQQWMINHATKQIEPFNPQAVAAMPMTFGEAKTSVKPNGQTKELMGRQCQGYDVELTVPMTLQGESITLKLAGPAWIAKDGPGLDEYRKAQAAFASAGLSTSVLGQGPQGKAMAEAAKALAAAGVVLEQETKMTMEGSGQMAQMMAQMGSTLLTMKVTAVSTDPIPDSKFTLPEGYTKK